jgi:hypothetical protein
VFAVSADDEALPSVVCPFAVRDPLKVVAPLVVMVEA